MMGGRYLKFIKYSRHDKCETIKYILITFSFWRLEVTMYVHMSREITHIIP